MIRPHLNVAGDDLTRHVEDQEGQGQEGTSKKITQSSQIRYGSIVRINVTRPHEEDNHPADVEEQRHLEHGGHHVGHQEDGCGGGVTRLQVADGEDEDQVTRNDQK